MLRPPMLRLTATVLTISSALAIVACDESSSSSSGTGGTGAAGTGGSGSLGAGGDGGASSVCSSAFTFAWRDEFDTFDTTRWSKATHTFTENQAQFSLDQVGVEDGKLVLSMIATAGTKPYVSGEARTNETFTYGCFVARAKFAKGSGLVSSLFTFYDEADFATNWNEIDVEFLGRYEDKVQFNSIATISGTKATAEQLVTLDFDPSADFHDYVVEWSPGKIVWLVDGEILHTQEGPTAVEMVRPQKLMMNLWPSSTESWVGPIDAAAADGARSEYDYVEYWTHTP